MNSVKVGLLTIGQSPRDDVVPEIKPHFLSHIKIVEAGLLDELTHEEIEHLKPKSGETPLVTRLRDGSQVQLSEKKISSLLPDVLNSIKTKLNVQAVGVLCTNDFPKTRFPFPVIFPFDYLKFLITHILQTKNLGVVVPLEDQIKMVRKKWEKEKVIVVAKSPYTEGKSWEEIAQRFIQEKVEAIILDCIGYNIKDRQEILSLLSAPVLLPRVLLASAINQLL
ncbi:MAG: AroM family protein [Candidatus Aminicenantaceae bacterium]